MRNPLILSGIAVGLSALLCAIPACWNDESEDLTTERRGHGGSGDPCNDHHGHGHGSGCVPPGDGSGSDFPGDGSGCDFPGGGSDFPPDAPPAPGFDAGVPPDASPAPPGIDAGLPCHGRHCGRY